MSAEKKVSLLILLLIALIATCVYTHVEEIEKKMNAQALKEAEVKLNEEPKEEIQTQEEKVEEKTEVSTEEKVEEETTKTEEIVEPKQEETQKPTFEKVEEEVLEEQPKDEVLDIPEEPLLTTDKRYKRVAPEKRIEELSRESQSLQIEINDYFRDNQIIFKRGSNNLTKQSFKYLEMITNILKENPNIKIEVAGHTDAAGARKLNQGISVGRAVAVKNLLIKNGIEKDRLKARGYGEDIPLVPNSPKGYSKVNRRVEFNIIEE